MNGVPRILVTTSNRLWIRSPFAIFPTRFLDVLINSLDLNATHESKKLCAPISTRRTTCALISHPWVSWCWNLESDCNQRNFLFYFPWGSGINLYNPFLSSTLTFRAKKRNQWTVNWSNKLACLVRAETYFDPILSLIL